MQTNLESPNLNRPSLLFPLPTRPLLRRDWQHSAFPVRHTNALPAACSQALQGRLVENLAWFALAASALGVLAGCFWPS